MIGNGYKWTYFARLLVTGTQGISNVLTVFNKTNFNLLTFAITPDGLVDYDELTGIFTFTRRGLVDIAATINIDSTAVSDMEIEPEYDDLSGGGFQKTNARIAELPVIGSRQTTFEGTLEQVDRGHRLRFLVRSPDGAASFKTEATGSGAVVPATVLHMKMFTR
jgi:hypothetical protein